MPLANARDTDDHRHDIEAWLQSCRPSELFDADGGPDDDILELAPEGELRMGAAPHANGRLLRSELRLPGFRDYAADTGDPHKRGSVAAEATRVLGGWLSDVMADDPTDFRIFGPDDKASNHLQGVYETTP